MRRMARPGRGPGGRWRIAVVVAVGALASAACTGSGSTETDTGIETERFVAVYVDLRMATLRSGADQLPVATRDSILASHGVTEADLLEFVEIHGRGAQYMHAVWDTIEDRIDRQRVPALGLDRDTTEANP